MNMTHVFHQGTDVTQPTLVLFHGTGGNEHDLLPLAGLLAPDASVLGIRGNVLENGMPRFFRRLAEGIFDEEDLIFRTHEVKQFLDEAAAKYGFDADNLVAVGYSNGANIAGSLLFHYGGIFRAAVLLHPMALRGLAIPSLQGFRSLSGQEPMIRSSAPKRHVSWNPC